MIAAGDGVVYWHNRRQVGVGSAFSKLTAQGALQADHDQSQPAHARQAARLTITSGPASRRAPPADGPAGRAGLEWAGAERDATRTENDSGDACPGIPSGRRPSTRRRHRLAPCQVVRQAHQEHRGRRQDGRRRPLRQPDARRRRAEGEEDLGPERQHRPRRSSAAPASPASRSTTRRSCTRATAPTASRC